MVRPRPGRWTGGLAVVSLTLAGASLAAQWLKYEHGHDTLFGLSQLLDVDLEQNIPTWFQSTLMVVAAVLLGLIAAEGRSRGERAWSRWLVLAALFVAGSIDEIASVHERFVIPEPVLGALSEFQVWSWILPGAAGVAVLVWWFRPFVRTLPRPTRNLLVAATAVFLTGAIGVEALGGLYAFRHGLANLPYNVLTTVEELLEMLGLVLFVHAWLVHLRGMGEISLRFGEPPG